MPVVPPISLNLNAEKLRNSKENLPYQPHRFLSLHTYLLNSFLIGALLFQSGNEACTTGKKVHEGNLTVSDPIINTAVKHKLVPPIFTALKFVRI